MILAVAMNLFDKQRHTLYSVAGHRVSRSRAFMFRRQKVENQKVAIRNARPGA
jgi:hypothetical protein